MGVLEFIDRTFEHDRSAAGGDIRVELDDRFGENILLWVPPANACRKDDGAAGWISVLKRRTVKTFIV